jgi:hypothetical protein
VRERNGKVNEEREGKAKPRKIERKKQKKFKRILISLKARNWILELLVVTSIARGAMS